MLKFYKFNCGFGAKFQRLSSRKICTCLDSEAARTPQLNL